MPRTRAALVLVILALVAGQMSAARPTTFRGEWTGQTVESAPLSPDHQWIVSSGPGTASHFGRFTMQSSQILNWSTLEVTGDHTFITHKGDQLVATYSGTLTERADGCLEGTLPATFTGNGTGRYAGATGGYDFYVVQCPAASGSGFDSTATFDGVLNLVRTR